MSLSFDFDHKDFVQAIFDAIQELHGRSILFQISYTVIGAVE